MMKSLFTTVILLLVSSTIALGQCSESDKQALEKFDHGWTDANARGDRTYLENVYADDYARTFFTGPTTKTEIIDAAVKSAAQAKASPQTATKVTADHFVITCTQNSATITHRTIGTTLVGGREQTFYSRGVHFLEKRGGRWQVVSLANYPLDDATQLNLMDNDWNEAVRKKDVAWFEQNLTDDFTFVNYQTGALQNKEVWLTNVKNNPASVESIESSEQRARAGGDLGVLTGMVSVKSRDAQGQSVSNNLRVTMTFVKRDGRWLVSGAHATKIQ